MVKILRKRGCNTEEEIQEACVEVRFQTGKIKKKKKYELIFFLLKKVPFFLHNIYVIPSEYVRNLNHNLS